MGDDEFKNRTIILECDQQGYGAAVRLEFEESTLEDLKEYVINFALALGYHADSVSAVFP